jgi:cytochrome c553
MQKLKITREVDLKVGVMQKLVKMWLLHRHYRKKALQQMKKKEEEQQIMEDPNQKWSMKPKKDGAIKKKKTL